MRELVFFADKHNEPTATKALTKALPLLRAKGFTTLFLECPYGDAGIHEMKMLTQDLIEMIQLFPDATVPPPAKRSLEQQRLINYLAKDGTTVDKIEKQVTANKDNLPSYQAQMEMFNELQELGMRLVNIDVRHPEAEEGVGGLENRNQFIWTYAKL